ncbi:hypothetical protein Drose_27115 [Dactylosporangium roseum]|uniref:Uncharacterized protein n=1 Tax=Dactylosporangium roseum TaxID=47989 RepID=A0ABY5YYL1_9ACTN|nr:hypothetical protein [Dactylosporangium roseum]UWZ34839.1 hypothetical protein Drose_27115 [Dactylosporangium roseum]
MASDPLAELGSFLTATEAQRLAAQIEAGQHTLAALSEIAAARRETVKLLLASAALGHADRERTVSAP